MIFRPVSFHDKQGRKVILRSAEEKDAGELIEYLRRTTEETPFLIREPDEVTLTVEQEKNFIESKKEDPQELMLVATIGGKHVGSCSLMSMSGLKRYQHRSDVGIALYKEYCGSGIGRKMMEVILDAARQLGYEQAELEVVSTNDTAISLYKSLGFSIYGTFPHSMKYSDGTYADAYWMMKYL